MGDIKSNNQKIYDYLSSQKVKNIGANADEFQQKMQDSSSRRKVYDYLSSKKVKNIGADFDAFSALVYDGGQQPVDNSKWAVTPSPYWTGSAKQEQQAPLPAEPAPAPTPEPQPAPAPQQQAQEQPQEQVIRPVSSPLEGKSREDLLEVKAEYQPDIDFANEYEARKKKVADMEAAFRASRAPRGTTPPNLSVDKQWLEDNKDKYAAAKERADEFNFALGGKNATYYGERIDELDKKEKDYQSRIEGSGRNEIKAGPGGFVTYPKDITQMPEDANYFHASQMLDMAKQQYRQGNKYDAGYQGDNLEKLWTAVSQFVGGAANNIDMGSFTFGLTEGSALKAARDAGDKYNDIINSALKGMKMSNGDINAVLSSIESNGSKLQAMEDELNAASSEIDTMSDTYEDMVRRGDPDAEAYGRNLQKKIDAYNKRINNEYKPAWDAYKRDSEAYKEVMSTIDAAVATGLTEGERAVLDAFDEFTRAKMERANDTSIAAKAGAGAEQSAEFMLDFILTGGISKAGTKVATKIATNRALKRLGADALKEMARVGKTVKPGLGLRLGTDVVTSLARTGVMFPRTIQAYSENLTEYSGKDEAGRYNFDRSQANALGNALLTQFIEYWSEGFGEYFGEAEQALFRGITKNAPKTAIGQTLKGYRGSIGQYLDKGKFDGMFNEMLEEVVGSTFNALAGWMSGDRVGDAGAMKEFFSGENLATLALSFLPMSAIGAATNVSAYHKMKERYDNGVAGLSKYFETGAVSPEELQQLSKDMPNLSPEEIKDKIVDITDRARKANGGRLPSDFTQNVLGYLEGEFAMGLRYDEWEDSQEKMSVVNAYTASYTNPDARAAWDLNDYEQTARQAAMEAGFTEDELDNDSYMLAQEAFEIKGTQPERSDVLMNYASAKAAAEGLRRGYAEQTQQVSEIFDERVRRNLDNNGAVTTATITLDGKPRTVFITQEDAGVDTTNGTLTTPTGPDGVVRYRLNEMDKERTAPASQFSNAQRTDTTQFIDEWQNNFQRSRAAYYETAQNTVSPTGQARALNERVGQSVIVTDHNGVYQPFKVERLTNGGSSVVLSGDKRALQGVAEAMGIRVPTSGYLEAPVTSLYPLLAKEEDGSLSTGVGETSQQEAATPAQEAAPAAEQTAGLGDLRDQTVPISLNGQALNAHVLNTADGRVVYEELDENGDVVRTASLPETEFASAMQEAANPTPAAESKQTQAVKPMDAKDFDIDSIDFDNNYVILHQTGTQNFDSILQNGLRVGAGLNGTTTLANRETLEAILQAQAEGRGHEGSDGLIILQIPKSWANGRDIRNLDQIDDILTERFGDSAIQTVPTNVITHAIVTPKGNTIPVDEKTGEKIYDAPGVEVADAIADLYATEGLTEADVDQYIAEQAAKAEAARNPERGNMSPQAWGQAKQEAARVADFWAAMQRAAEQRKAQQEAAIEEAVEEATPVETAEAQPAAESKRRIAPAETPMTFDSRRRVVARLKNWARRTGVKVNIIRSVDEVKDETARKALKEGRALTGWFNDKTGQVDIFLPNVMNAVEADKTFIHETVAHKGLSGLLGEEGYDALCDRVWNELMTPEEQQEFMEYNRHLQGSDEYLRRAAADEYIARLSENMDMQDNRNIFEKIVDWIMDLLGLGGNVSGIEEGAAGKATAEGPLTRSDLYDLLEDSLKRFEKGRKKLNTESLPAEIQNEMQAKGLVMDGGAVMDEQQDELKKAAGYKTPNELDMESSPEVGNVRFSESTMPAWARNYMTYRDAKKHVVQVLENFVRDVAADELVHGMVPTGVYKYGEKSSGSFSGPLRTNIEYIVTFDMDTSCPRSLQYLEYVNQIEAMIGRPLTQRESVQLIEMMRMYGQMIPCVYCYCENKRQALKQYYTDFMRARNGVINAKTEEEALAAMYGHNTTAEAQESNDPAVVLTPAALEVFKKWREEKDYNPTIEQLWYQYRNDRNVILTVLDNMLDSGAVSTDLSDQKITNALCKDLGITGTEANGAVRDIVSEWKWDRIEDRRHNNFTRIEDEDDLVVDNRTLTLWREMTSYGKSASGAKNVLRYVPYTDELKDLSQEQRDFINGLGGLRMHSSNDFRIDYVLDYFQFMADMAVNHMFGHTYTKSPEFVRIFGNSGYKINMSIAAYEDSRGIRPNADEGFDWTTARELREAFPNAGVMLMATSDAQIQFALDNDWIDMCIPFHHSGLPKAIWYEMRAWSDYSSTQNEKFLNATEMRKELKADGVAVPNKLTAAAVEKMYIDHFNIKILRGKDGKRMRPHFLPGPTPKDGVIIPGHNNDYDTYIRLCREYGVHPRFYGIKVKDNTPEGGGREVDITEHPGYMKFIKETARTDSPQTAIEFNFDQPSEALGGRSPIEYALEELKARAQAESEMAGGPVRNIYESYKQDPYGIVPQFINGVINHEEEYRKTHNGKELPLDYLTPDSRKWFMTERKALESAYKDFDTIPYHPHEYDENGNLIMEPEVKVTDLDVSKPVDEGGTHFREVTRPGTIKKLEDGPKVKVYRSMQFIPDPKGDVEYDLGDGNGLQKGFLYAPMSAKVDGKWRDPIHLNRWEEAEENPDMADENGDFYLDKGDGSGLMKVAYAPYLHTRRSPLNEQFSSAYKRGNLVIVESEIPESELTSNYTADKSKKSTGEHDWPSGKVSNALAKKGMDTRKVILSRWAKPVRLVPNSEVADEIVKLLGKSKLSFPYNVVTPGLRAELAKRGVRFDGWQGNKPDNVDELIASMKEENESVSNTRFREANRNQLGFVSNADAALDRIKMDKATPEQWVKMLEKEGGLKAGEDKWLGLSDWLKSQDRKSITKDEIADYIDEHRIMLAEAEYMDAENLPYGGSEKWNDYVAKEFGEDVLDAFNFYEGEAGTSFDFRDEDKAAEVYKRLQKEFGLDHEIETEPGGEYTRDDMRAMRKLADEIAIYADSMVIDTNPISYVRIGYTTEGLDNKREIALVVPTIEPWNEGDKVHFGDAGNGRAVAWVRFGDTFAANEGEKAAKEKHREAARALNAYRDGLQEKYADSDQPYSEACTPEELSKLKSLKEEEHRLYEEWDNLNATPRRVLVIDEIQSKRHQEGREKGYVASDTDIAALEQKWRDASAAYDEYIDSLKEKYGGYEGMRGHITEEENQRAIELNDASIDAANAVDRAKGGIPAAPFEKNWHELAMKRMLRLAAEEGYDAVAWTTGGQQAERYNIGGKVDWIQRGNDFGQFPESVFIKMGDKVNSVEVDENGTIVDSTHALSDTVGKPLSDLLGKELANKIMSAETGPNGRLEGEGLRVGGEGMRGFYDEILPRFMNKYGKKWGVKVSDITLPNVEKSGEIMHSVPVTQEMKESVMQGQTMFRERITPEQDKEYMDAVEAGDMEKAQRMVDKAARAAGYTIHAYHGTDSEDGEMPFTVFESGHFTDDYGFASYYNDEYIYDVYIKMDNPYEYDFKGQNSDWALDENGNRITTHRVFNRAIEEGYDGVILTNVDEYGDGIEEEDGEYPSSVTDYIPATPNQIKSAEPVTYDDNGNVVPLSERFNPENNDIRFREARPVDARSAQTGYEEEIQKKSTVWRLEWQDQDIPVRAAINKVMNEVGMTDLPEDCDYLTRHNLVSSRADAQMHNYKLFYFEPMMQTIGQIEDILAGGKPGFFENLFGSRKQKRLDAYKKIVDYCYAVSALERNAWKRAEAQRLMEKALERLSEKWEQERAAINADSRLTAEEKAKAIERAEKRYQKESREIEDKYADRDYSGITALMGHPKEEWQEAEDEARAMIAAFQRRVNNEDLINEMWDRIRACTDFNLEHAYKFGLLSRAEYERLHGTESQPRMWEYYLPLRGFKERTAEDEYNYTMFTSDMAGGAVVTEAKGRVTEADDPFATMRHISELEIVQGLQNWAKQSLYNFVLRAGENSLLTQVEPWYVKEPGSDNWTVAEPNEGESLEEFEARMQEAYENGEARRGRNGLKLGHIMGNKMHRNQHIIRLKLNGAEKMIWVNGNPILAQSVNGVPGWNNWYTQNVNKVNRALSQFYTTYSLKFITKNKLRDTQFSRIAALVDEPQAYLTQLEKNWWANNGYVAFGYPMMKLVAEWESGELEKKEHRTEREQMFIDFMYDGGATGYSMINSMDKIKRELKKMVENAGHGESPLNPIRWYAMGVGALNEASELLTRFTFYQTSRMMGRSRERSAYDAKESSVNFNRRGLRSGKGAAGWTAAAASTLYLFINPAIQGLDKFVRLHKSHPWKMGLVDATYFMMGFVNSLLNAMVAGASDGGDGDDEEKMGPDWYWNIPEWVRRSNMIIGSPFKKLGKWGYLVIALPIEYKGFYAMGELVSSIIQGKYAAKDAPTLANEAVGVVAELLPINPVEGYTPGDNVALSVVRNMMPDIAAPIMDVATNRSFAGIPLWKENIYDEAQPLSQSAFASTPEILNKAVIKLSEVTSTMPWHIDIPSGAVRGLLKGYGGGGYTFVEDVSKLIFADAAHPRHWDNVPFVGGFTGYLEEDRRNSYNNNMLQRYKELSDDVVKRVRSAAPGEDLKAADIYNKPESLPQNARVTILLNSDEYILGKMYYNGMLKAGDDVKRLRTAWNKAKKAYLDIADDKDVSDEAKDAAEKEVQKAWLDFTTAEDGLVNSLLEEEYNHARQKIANGVPYEKKETLSEKAYKLTNRK